MLRSAPLDPAGPLPRRVPTIKGLVVPPSYLNWEALFGFTGFCALRLATVGDTVESLAEAKIAGDAFYVVAIHPERSKDIATKVYVFAVRDGAIRAKAKLNGCRFCSALLDLQALEDEIGILREILTEIYTAQLTEFGGKLLVSTAHLSALLDPETLALVAASTAGCALVDASSTTLPTCVALEWDFSQIAAGKTTRAARFIRLGLDLLPIARSETALKIDVISSKTPIIAGFINFALTLRGQIVALGYGPGESELHARVFDPDFREIWAEPCGRDHAELFAVDDKFLTFSARNPAEPPRLLELALPSGSDPAER